MADQYACPSCPLTFEKFYRLTRHINRNGHCAQQCANAVASFNLELSPFVLAECDTDQPVRPGLDSRILSEPADPDPGPGPPRDEPSSPPDTSFESLADDPPSGPSYACESADSDAMSEDDACSPFPCREALHMYLWYTTGSRVARAKIDSLLELIN